MSQKRQLDDQDPDYDDVSTTREIKRRKLLEEEDGKEATVLRIRNIVQEQFATEICSKEEELDLADKRLNEVRHQLDRLRACIVASFYSNAGKGLAQRPSVNQPPSIHPCVKTHIGKTPKHSDADPERSATSVPTTESSTKIPVPTNVQNTEKKVQPSVTTKKEKFPERNVEAVPGPSQSKQGTRFNTKKRIIVGNVSKYIPIDRRDENDPSTHKWMVYVRGPKDSPSVDHFVKKVWFFLHPSYKPNDLVEVSQSPFHLTRRGWGEFPVRVQLHFIDPRNKRVDIIHQLKLDKTYTGLQTNGAETLVDIELVSDGERCKTPTESHATTTANHNNSSISETDLNKSNENSVCSQSSNSALSKSEGDKLSECVSPSSAQSSFKPIVPPESVNPELVALSSKSEDSNGVSESSAGGWTRVQIKSEPSTPDRPASQNSGWQDICAMSSPERSAFDDGYHSTSLPSTPERPSSACSFVKLDQGSNKKVRVNVSESHALNSPSRLAATMHLTSKPDTGSGSRKLQSPTPSNSPCTPQQLVYVRCVDASGKVYLVPQNSLTKSPVTSTATLPLVKSLPGVSPVISRCNALQASQIPSVSSGMVLTKPQTNTASQLLQTVAMATQGGNTKKGRKTQTTVIGSGTSTATLTYMLASGRAGRGTNTNTVSLLKNMPVQQPGKISPGKHQAVAGPRLLANIPGKMAGSPLQLLVPGQGFVQLLQPVISPVGRGAGQVLAIANKPGIPVSAANLLISPQATHSAKDSQRGASQLLTLPRAKSPGVASTQASTCLTLPVVRTQSPVKGVANPVMLLTADVGQGSAQRTNKLIPGAVSLLRPGLVLPKPSLGLSVSPGSAGKECDKDARQLTGSSTLTASESSDSQTHSTAIPFHVTGNAVNSQGQIKLSANTQSLLTGGGNQAVIVTLDSNTPSIVRTSSAPVIHNIINTGSFNASTPGLTLQQPSSTKLSKTNTSASGSVLNRTHSAESVTFSAIPRHKVSGYKSKVDREPVKPIFTIQLADHTTLCSVVKSLAKQLPLVNSKADRSVFPFCAPSEDIFMSWNIGKRRAAEWQRAYRVRQAILSQLDGATVLYGCTVWTTKQIYIWCRHNGFTPLDKETLRLYNERPPVPQPVPPSFSSYTEPQTIMEQLDIKLSEAEETNQDVDDELSLDIINLDSPISVEKTTSKSAGDDKKRDQTDMATVLTRSSTAEHIHDHVAQLGIRLPPVDLSVYDVDPSSSSDKMSACDNSSDKPVYTSVLEDMLQAASHSFVDDILRKSMSLLMEKKIHVEELGVYDIFSALKSLPQCDFLTGENMGVARDDRLNTVVKQERGGGR